MLQKRFCSSVWTPKLSDEHHCCVFNRRVFDRAPRGKCGLPLYETILSVVFFSIVFGQKCQLPSAERSTLLCAHQFWRIIIFVLCLIFHLKRSRALTLREDGFNNDTNEVLFQIWPKAKCCKNQCRVSSRFTSESAQFLLCAVSVWLFGRLLQFIWTCFSSSVDFGLSRSPSLASCGVCCRTPGSSSPIRLLSHGTAWHNDSLEVLYDFERNTDSVWSVQAIHSVSWHHEGKQFMCSHSDGSLTLWNLRNTTKPFQVTFPHGETHTLS